MPGSVASGAATLLLARIIPPIASFGVFYLAVVHWGPDAWGLFHLLLSVHAVLQMVSGLGIDLMVLQRVAAQRRELPPLLRAVSGLLFRTGLFFGAAMVAVAWSLSSNNEVRLAAVWFGAALPASSLSPALEAAWISLGRTHRVATVVLCEHGLRVFGSFIALSMGGGPAALAFVLFGSKWLGTALLLLPLRKIEGSPEPIGFATLAKQASPFALYFVVTAFLGRIDSLSLSVFRPLNDVGYYGTAIRLVFLPTIASQVFGIALYPHLAKARRVPERFDRLLRVGLLTLCAVSFIPAALFIAFAEPVLHLLRMEDYLPAAPILALLAFALPAWFSTDVLFRALVAKERLGDCLRAAAIQVGLGVAAMVWATKMYGTEGAAAAAVAVAWLGTVVYSCFLLRESAVWLQAWLLVLLIGATVIGGSHALAAMHPDYALTLIGMYTFATLAWGVVYRDELSVLIDVN